MQKKCSQSGCNAPKAFCKKSASPNYQDCSNWTVDPDPDNKNKRKAKGRNKSIPWSGVAMEPDDIQQLAHRSTPQIIGIVGAANAGKTSYLGMLYTLLFNGKKFDEWKFAGSNTLIAWETQAKCLKVKPSGKVDYPEPTPSHGNYYSLYHLALRKANHLYDILFADSSGEVFSKWSKNIDDPSVDNARWVYKHANAFLLFINCEAIIEEKGKARIKITQLIAQISANLHDRPVAVVWSKGDKMKQLEKDYPKIKQAIERSIMQYLPNAESYIISNFSKTDPDQFCHVNNLRVTEYLLNMISKPKPLKLKLEVSGTSDLFFQYRGSYGNQ